MSTFFVLAGHGRSMELKDFEAYDQRGLYTLFKSQPAINKFKDNRCFVSVGYAINPNSLEFNNCQKEHILYWIMKTINPTESSISNFKSQMHFSEEKTEQESRMDHAISQASLRFQHRPEQPRHMDHVAGAQGYPQHHSNVVNRTSMTSQPQRNQEVKRCMP